jgi:kynurenine 3-monooxygenase
MFIAIPSRDFTFTCTLFAPQSTFDMLSADPRANLPTFFAKFFPGVTPDLIPTEDLINQFLDSPHLPLISIKCAPYHYKSNVVILGDAAHAMVPFYGQGMNAGLEDVRVLFEHFDRSGVYFTKSLSERKSARRAALDAYTEFRAPDASAINDLALQNYLEMRSSVTSPVYRLRKWTEERLNVWVPSMGWSTQYSRVSFGNERYSEVRKQVARQGQLLVEMLVGGAAGLGMVGVGLAWWLRMSGGGNGRGWRSRWLP